MEFIFDVRGDKLTCDTDTVLVEGNKGTYTAKFEFDSAWDGYAKVCIFENEGECVPIAVINDSAVLPLADRISAKIGVIGVLVSEDGENSTDISTNMLAIGVKSGAAGFKALEKLGQEAQVWEVHLTEMKKYLDSAKENAEEAVEKVENAANEKLEIISGYAEQARESAAAAANSEAESGLSRYEAEVSALEAKGYAGEAKTAAENAEESETKSASSQKSAEQALSDLLAMINSGDIVLAQDGKLPLSSIPATATQEIYVVESEDDLTSLTAQRGDLAELVETVDGERTITKTWQCLGDSTKRENWVVWGTSYAVQSGNSEHSNTSTNATMINGHRIVEMSEEEFNNAVKDDDTYYLVC